MLLAARLGNEGTSKGRNQRFMVNEKSERTALKEVPVMEKRRVDSLEFLIESGVTLLGRSEFGGEKERGCQAPCTCAGGQRQCENQRQWWLGRQEQWGGDERGEWQRPVLT